MRIGLSIVYAIEPCALEFPRIELFIVSLVVHRFQFDFQEPFMFKG